MKEIKNAPSSLENEHSHVMWEVEDLDKERTTSWALQGRQHYFPPSAGTHTLYSMQQCHQWISCVHGPGEEAGAWNNQLLDQRLQQVTGAVGVSLSVPVSTVPCVTRRATARVIE